MVVQIVLHVFFETNRSLDFGHSQHRWRLAIVQVWQMLPSEQTHAKFEGKFFRPVQTSYIWMKHDQTAALNQSRQELRQRRPQSLVVKQSQHQWQMSPKQNKHKERLSNPIKTWVVQLVLNILQKCHVISVYLSKEQSIWRVLSP